MMNGRPDYPKKRDWKKGTPQLGLFLRMADGATVNSIHDRVTPLEYELALALLHGGRHLPTYVAEAIKLANDKFRKEGEG